MFINYNNFKCRTCYRFQQPWWGHSYPPPHELCCHGQIFTSQCSYFCTKYGFFGVSSQTWVQGELYCLSILLNFSWNSYYFFSKLLQYKIWERMVLYSSNNKSFWPKFSIEARNKGVLIILSWKILFFVKEFKYVCMKLSAFDISCILLLLCY